MRELETLGLPRRRDAGQRGPRGVRGGRPSPSTPNDRGAHDRAPGPGPHQLDGPAPPAPSRAGVAATRSISPPARSWPAAAGSAGGTSSAPTAPTRRSAAPSASLAARLFRGRVQRAGARLEPLRVECDPGALANGYFWVFPHPPTPRSARWRPSAWCRRRASPLPGVAASTGSVDREGVPFEGATLEVAYHGCHFPAAYLAGDAAGVPSVAHRGGDLRRARRPARRSRAPSSSRVRPPEDGALAPHEARTTAWPAGSRVPRRGVGSFGVLRARGRDACPPAPAGVMVSPGLTRAPRTVRRPDPWLGARVTPLVPPTRCSPPGDLGGATTASPICVTSWRGSTKRPPRTADRDVSRRHSGSTM